MSAPRIHRFDFNGLRDFRGPIVMQAEVAPVEVAPPPPPPPTFSEAELDASRMAGRKQGYTEGFTAGRQEAQRETDRRAEDANAAISKLADAVGNLQTSYHRMLLTEATQLKQLITTIARKVAGEAINARGVETIEAVVERCLPVIFTKPRVIIELHPGILEAAIERIENQLRREGFEGEIQFRSNEDLGISDISIDWITGQVSRSEAALWEEIHTLLERVPLELTFAETLNTTIKPTGE